MMSSQLSLLDLAGIAFAISSLLNALLIAGIFSRTCNSQIIDRD
jgi:hypothetical protein